MNNLNLFDYMYIILYICKETTNKTSLNKLLFFIDYSYASINGYKQTITNDNYVILPFGPVPDTVERVKYITIKEGFLIKNEIKHSNYIENIYTTTDSINLKNIEKVIKKIKLDVIKTIVSILKNKKAKYLSELSHRLDPWKSYAKEWGKVICPEDMQNDEVYEKYKVNNLYELIKEKHFETIMKDY